MARLLTRAAGSLWLRLAVSAAILGYLASEIDMTAAARSILSVKPGHLLLVLGLVAVDRAVMIARWIQLLRASDIDVETRHAASIFLISSFVGSFLPASIGSDAARAYGLSRSAASGSEAVASVAVDRLLGVLSLVIMGGVGLLAWSPPGAVGPAVALGIVILVAASIAAFFADTLVRAVLPPQLRGAAAMRVIAIGDAVSRYRRRRAVLARVLVWSLVVQILRIVQAYVLGLGLGIAVPFRYYLLFMPVGLLMLLLPVSVSGFGLPQGVIVWLLRPLGVPDEQSLALSTLIVLTGLAGNLPGLILWLRSRPPR